MKRELPIMSAEEREAKRLRLEKAKQELAEAEEEFKSIGPAKPEPGEAGHVDLEKLAKDAAELAKASAASAFEVLESPQKPKREAKDSETQPKPFTVSDFQAVIEIDDD